MKKLYQRINWQNYPSDSTPLNESNLNKMDAAVDGIDDRVVTLDVAKLPVATANTMVKDVTFNESTGVFTITKLNGTKVTVNTALEKIATNFRYDYSTQKLILTLIDKTTQEVDLSALLTQYEFLNSSTIQFTIDSSGKVKASVVNGSITGDMLEPNYLANVTLQASKADTSAKNAKESEEKAAEYAENAKNSADSAEPVASTATGTNPAIQDSTNAPIIYGKFKGYTLQDGEPTPDNPIEINGLDKGGAIEVKTCGKNVFGGLALAQALVDSGSTNVVLDTDAKTISFQNNTTGNIYVLFDDFKENTQYTFVLDVASAVVSSDGKYYSNLLIEYTDGTRSNFLLTQSTARTYVFVSDANKTVFQFRHYYAIATTTTLNYEQCGIFEGVITADEFEPYTETTASIQTDAPLYEGDYLEVYADGSGRLVRAMTEAVFDGSDDEGWSKTFWTQPEDTTLVTYGVMGINGVVSNDQNPSWCNVTKWNLARGILNTHHMRNNNSIGFTLSAEKFPTLDALRTRLVENPIHILYELAKPTETPLTAEQVAQFKKLYTFEPVTNVLCDGEVEMVYLKNTNGGKALASVRRGVEHADTATTATTATKATQDGNGNVIAETYYKKTNFDKIVGGTVEPSGKTNVQYSVPTDVSSKGVVVQTNTSGNLINALSKATASISGFFSILYNAVKTRYLGRIDLGMSATQNTYDFTSFAGYDRYTFVFKGQDANRSLFTRELLTIHNIEKNTSNVGKVCLNIPNNYTFEPWVEMYPSGNKTYVVVGITDTTGLTTLVSGLFVEVYGAMD